MSHAEKVWKAFLALDRALQAKGFPATSPWWQETVRRWYLSGRRQLVGRVGRRGGKSSTLVRLAVAEALYGDHAVPPGDIGIVAIISARRSDAEERIRTIKAILDALSIPYAEKGDLVEVLGGRRGFQVFTASISGVSGFTAIFVLCDEVAKWRDKDTGTNPATVVIQSVRPAMATQRNARIVLSSSPMGLLDAHAASFAAGETKLQIVASAPTWLANPTLTEEDTRGLEPDEVVWSREYAAVPQAEAETSLLGAAVVDRACVDAHGIPRAGDAAPDERHRYVAAIDPATRGNAWTLVVAARGDGDRRIVALCREWRGTRQKPLSPSKVFGEIAALLAPYRLKVVYADQWAEDALRELARPQGLALLVDKPWSPQTKAEAYEQLRMLFHEQKIEIPDDPQVKTDLLGIRQRLTRNGTSYELATQGARHSDYAPAIALAVDFARVPPTPRPHSLSDRQIADRQKLEFLLGREKERKHGERFGRIPATHEKLN